MLNSERFALAARLHVMLRRKAGRVTDTEWLATNQDYAAEIVRFSTEFAKNEGHDDLAELAEKFAAVMSPPSAPAATYKRTDLSHEEPGKIRYVGGIR
jgi:hypothetical protein